MKACASPGNRVAISWHSSHGHSTRGAHHKQMPAVSPSVLCLGAAAETENALEIAGRVDRNHHDLALSAVEQLLHATAA